MLLIPAVVMSFPGRERAEAIYPLVINLILQIASGIRKIGVFHQFSVLTGVVKDYQMPAFAGIR